MARFRSSWIYQVRVPDERARYVDEMIDIFLKTHPTATHDDAVDAIFDCGLQVALDGGAITTLKMIEAKEFRA